MPPPPTVDRAQGVFETLLVHAGAPIELGAHLERLSASLAALYDAPPPPRLAAEVARRARGIELGRLRIDVRAAAGIATAELRAERVDAADFFPAWERGAQLHSLDCPGGLGAHKWADRRALEAAPAGTLPLLLDRGGEVLEAGRANVFVARGGALFTPAADGRVLPGIARAGAIAAAREAGIEVSEGPLARAELFGADEVFLTGSVRGVEPARALDGEPLPARTEISRRVGAGLRRRWLGALAAVAAPAPAGAPRPGPLAR
jgi:para-aminobenzoate synthetase/4-amino-4-deoxychorismate lyase